MTEGKKSPGTSKGWLMVFIVTFAGIVAMMNQYKVPPIQRDLMKVFQLGAASAGWLTSVFALAGLILAIPAAFIFRGIGPKKTGMLALGSAVVGVFIGALSNSFVLLMASRVIEGISVGLMGVVGPSIIAMYFDRAKSGLPMGIWNIWYATGSFVAYNVAVPIATMAGGGTLEWKNMWWFGDIMAFIAFLLIAFFITGPKAKDAVVNPSLPLDKPLNAPAKDVTKTAEGFKVGRAWILAIGFCFLMMTSISFLTWAPTYFREAFHWNPAKAGSMSSLGYVTSIPASLICGLLLAKFKTIKQRNIMLVLCGVIEMAVYPWCFFVPESFMSTYLILCGLTTGFTAGCVWAAIPITMPKKATIPLGMGLLQAFKSLANLTATPLVGSIVQVGGTPDKPVFDWSRGMWPIALFGLLSISFMIIYSLTKPPVFEEDIHVLNG
ncbi:MAG: MFS transporter [Clostridiales bacterium]|nr:MFS transporter [Clostridiales bacterium]